MWHKIKQLTQKLFPQKILERENDFKKMNQYCVVNLCSFLPLISNVIKEIRVN